MKITSSGLERYQSAVQNAKSSESSLKSKVAGGSAGRADKVTLSENAACRAELSRLASALSSEVEGAASPERLSELRQAVQDGSYHVASGDIADAILDLTV